LFRRGRIAPTSSVNSFISHLVPFVKKKIKKKAPTSDFYMGQIQPENAKKGHFFSSNGFGLYVLSSKICLIFSIRGGNFDFLRGLHRKEIN